MSKRALVVDECAVARSVIVILLQRSGWEVVGAADGAEALRLAASWHFDLVITDPEPTKVPGQQLLRILRGGLLSPAVRVILHVEHPDAAGEARLLADEILVKNGQIEKQLQSKLGRLFGGSTPRAGRRVLQKYTSRRKIKCAASRHYS
jgi:two-component system KDP operon response regulator KdpE